MSKDSTDLQYQPLGQFLRKARLEMGFDLRTIANDTKISRKNLMAIEADEFEQLPAEAFTKGFYKIYAQKLDLDPQTILRRYVSERPPKYVNTSRGHMLPHYLDVETSEMAKRPSPLPATLFGLSLFMVLLFGGFVCWYFSWNPASYLSHKLRGIEQTEQAAEQVQHSKARSKETFYEVIYLGDRKRAPHHDLLSFPSPGSAIAGTIEQDSSSQVSQVQQIDLLSSQNRIVQQ